MAKLMLLFFFMGCMPHVVPVRVTVVNNLFKKVEKKLKQVIFTLVKHNKSHDRAADKMGFSIALKRTLVAEIERLAEAEGRNRNQQIAWMLGEALAMRAEKRIACLVQTKPALPPKHLRPGYVQPEADQKSA